jgi:hypothetical protein
LPETLVIYSDSSNYSDIFQDLSRSQFFTKNGTNFILPILNSYIQFDFDIALALDGLNSDLEKPGLTDSVRNELKSNSLVSQLTPRYTYRKDRFYLSLSAPIIYNLLNVKDKQNNTDNSFSRLKINPSASVKFTFSSFLDAQLQGRIDTRIGDITDFTQSFIQTDYRNLRFKSGILAETKTSSGSLRITYKNPLIGFFWYLSGMYSGRKYNQMSQQNFDSSTGISGNYEKGTSSQTLMFSGNASKNLRFINSTISLSASYNSIASQRRQQDVVYPSTTDSWEISPRINSRIAQSLIVSYNARFSGSKMRIGSVRQGFGYNQMQTAHLLRIVFLPVKSAEIEFGSEYARNKGENPTFDDELFFSDMRFSYKLKQIELGLNLNNLFNQKEFVQKSFSGLDSRQTTTFYRPRKFLFVVAFKY